MSDHSTKSQHTSEHYVKLGFVDPIIGLDVPSGNSILNPEMVENTLIFNSNPQDQQHINYNHELMVKSQEWDEYIANKKTVMKIILDPCDEDTRAEVSLGSPYEDNMKAGELIKFLVRVHKVYDDTEDKDVFFGSRVTRITKHHF